MEIEIKVKVENIRPLLTFLEEKGKFKYTHNQIDEYYTPAHRNFVDVNPIEEWLRLRNSNGKFFITYKKHYYEEDGRSHYADEFESAIDNLEQMNNIFKVLNFKYLITVDKNRSSWNYNDYEISLDSVKELGEFVEVEYKGKDANPKEITDQMMQFLMELECGNLERNFKGYPYLLLEKKQ